MSDKHQEQLVAELLDAALARYRSVEPRAGLEERILANLQTKQQAMRWFNWQWGPVLAGAALVSVLFVSLQVTKRAVDSASAPAPMAVQAQPSSQPLAQQMLTQSEVKRSQATPPAVAARRVTRRPRVTEPALSRLLAQQTRRQASGDLHIEEVKIPAVAVAEIVIR